MLENMSPQHPFILAPGAGSAHQCCTWSLGPLASGDCSGLGSLCKFRPMISKEKAAGVFMALEREMWETSPFPSGRGQRSMVTGHHPRIGRPQPQDDTLTMDGEAETLSTWSPTASLSCRVSSIHSPYIPLRFKSFRLLCQ